MDLSQVRLLEIGMSALQRSIPENERCPKCKGRGQIEIGCALIHAIYGTCHICWGNGRAKAYLIGEIYEIKDMIKKVELCPTCKQWATSLARNKELNSRDYRCENGHRWRLNRTAMKIEVINP